MNQHISVVTISPSFSDQKLQPSCQRVVESRLSSHHHSRFLGVVRHHVILCKQARPVRSPRNSRGDVNLGRIWLILAEPVNGSALDDGNPAILRAQNLDTGRYGISNPGREISTLAEASNENHRDDSIACHGYLLPDEAGDVLHNGVKYAASHLFLWYRESIASQPKAFAHPDCERLALG